jgi:hypothetical protein
LPRTHLPSDEAGRNGADEAQRRPYHAPELTDLGSLPDVTHTSFTGTYTGSADGGESFPYVYAS